MADEVTDPMASVLEEVPPEGDENAAAQLDTNSILIQNVDTVENPVAAAVENPVIDQGNSGEVVIAPTDVNVGEVKAEIEVSVPIVPPPQAQEPQQPSNKLQVQEISAAAAGLIACGNAATSATTPSATNIPGVIPGTIPTKTNLCMRFNDQWEKNFQEVVAFKEREKRLPFVREHKGQWLLDQRTLLGREGHMSKNLGLKAERIRRLAEIGVNLVKPKSSNSGKRKKQRTQTDIASQQAAVAQLAQFKPYSLALIGAPPGAMGLPGPLDIAKFQAAHLTAAGIALPPGAPAVDINGLLAAGSPQDGDATHPHNMSAMLAGVPPAVAAAVAAVAPDAAADLEADDDEGDEEELDEDAETFSDTKIEYTNKGLRFKNEWEDNFNEVLKFKEEKGRLPLVREKEHKGQWLIDQRTLLGKDSHLANNMGLKLDRIRRLTELGVTLIKRKPRKSSSPNKKRKAETAELETEDYHAAGTTAGEDTEISVSIGGEDVISGEQDQQENQGEIGVSIEQQEEYHVVGSGGVKIEDNDQFENSIETENEDYSGEDVAARNKGRTKQTPSSRGRKSLGIKTSEV